MLQTRQKAQLGPVWWCHRGTPDSPCPTRAWPRCPPNPNPEAAQSAAQASSSRTFHTTGPGSLGAALHPTCPLPTLSQEAGPHCGPHGDLGATEVPAPPSRESGAAVTERPGTRCVLGKSLLGECLMGPPCRAGRAPHGKDHSSLTTDHWPRSWGLRGPAQNPLSTGGQAAVTDSQLPGGTVCRMAPLPESESPRASGLSGA